MFYLFGYYLSPTTFMYICGGIALLLYTIFSVCILIGNSAIYLPYEKLIASRVISDLRRDKQKITKAAMLREENESRAKIFKNLKIFPLSYSLREELEELIEKLNITDIDGAQATVDSIYVKSCIGMTVTMVVVLVLSILIHPLIILMCAVPLVRNMPFSNLRKKNVEFINAIEYEMPELINMFYYRFRNPQQDLRLDILIDDYLNLSGPEMRILLLKVLTDIKNVGTLTAITNLQDRYPESMYINMFCTVAQGMWEKQPNAYLQLENLFVELSIRKKDSEIDEMEHNDRKAVRATYSIWVLFFILVIVFLVFQMAQ